MVFSVVRTLVDRCPTVIARPVAMMKVGQGMRSISTGQPARCPMRKVGSAGIVLIGGTLLTTTVSRAMRTSAAISNVSNQSPITPH